MQADGFVLSVNARIVTGPTYQADGTQQPTSMVTVAGAVGRFDLESGLDGTGNTQVVLPNAVTETGGGSGFSAADFQDTPLLVSGTGYHLYQLTYDPTTQTASLSVDGTLERTGYAGVTSVSGGTTNSNYGLVFGSLNYGTTNFAAVTITVGGLA